MQDGVSVLPVEAVDGVSKEYLKIAIENVKSYLKENDIKLNKKEVSSIVAMMYQYGREASFYEPIINQFVTCGGANQTLYDTLQSPGGTFIFKQTAGGTQYFPEGYPNETGKTIEIDRGTAFWLLCKDGILAVPDGPFLIQDDVKNITSETVNQIEEDDEIR